MADPGPAQAGGLRFLPCGDTGLTVQLGEVIDRATNARVQALRRAIDAAAIDGVVETVPAYVSLTVHYDPLSTSLAVLSSAIEALAAGTDADAPSDGRVWSLPVCFEGEDFAPDLGHVADWAGLSGSEVIEDLVGAEQFVYMLGFAPGQPYLGDLPDRLAIPRRENPVQAIPAGSVVIATGKTVIYPASNPTGWHIVGRTPVPLFDIGREKPVLLDPGDTVRLRPIGRDMFDDIHHRARTGAYAPDIEAAG